MKNKGKENMVVCIYRHHFKGFTYGGIALEWIFNAENIDIALVEKMMKHINGLNCGRSLLFEAENPVKNQKIGMMYSDPCTIK